MVDEISSKGLIFDAGPIINFTLNNLLWVLPRLKHTSGLRFYITKGVKEELIDRPLRTKKYKLEALQILPHIVEGTIEIIDTPQIHALSEELEALLNNAMVAKGHAVNIVQKGELTAMAAYLLYDLQALVVDERTTRHLIETPSRLQNRMKRKLHTAVTWKTGALPQIKKKLSKIRCLRSVELVSVAYNKGFFCHYTHDCPAVRVPDIDDQLLEGLLWALKLNGCAISEQEVKDIYLTVRKTKKSCSIDKVLK